MAELIVRNAKPEDIEEIAIIEQECFAVPWTRDALEYDLFENHLSTYVVAELEGKVVGYVGLWIIVDEAHINNVAVSKEYRRKHIGSALIASMIDYVESAGIKNQTLEVRAGNVPAIGLYKSFGFEEEGIRPGYYEDNGEDAIIMWRRAN